MNLKLLAFVGAVALAANTPEALGTAPPEIALTAKWAPGDTIRVIARWGVSQNNLGPADTYEALWTTNKGFRAERNKTGLADTALIPLPVPPDSVQVTVRVTAFRRGVASTPVTASKWFKRGDAPPPPPGPIIIDTTSFFVTVDSVGVWLSRNNITVGDVTEGCALVHAGTRWYVATPSIRVTSTQTSLTQARLDAYAEPVQNNCSFVYAPRGLVLDSLMPVTWTTDTIVSLGSGGPESREVFGVKVRGKHALVRNARAH